MVWSSAQPRNVDDMVHHVFGDLANDLKAIWARYAWLNLRDPWNHILVKECRVEERKHDLGVFSHKIRPANLPNHTPRKALEKEKEISAMTDRMLSKLSLKDSEEQCDRYDDFLLAVVGILDALEYENSVTAWLQSGGIVLCGKESLPSLALAVQVGCHAHLAARLSDKSTILRDLLPPALPRGRHVTRQPGSSPSSSRRSTHVRQQTNVHVTACVTSTPTGIVINRASID
ncbi:hypothetical protein BT96DRAFT_1005340 [Gymnopus androsaceus JB14]|uniref:Uncharacterized protein n=1 Tax=Gymnopus androsaceus JB14 TaxID=1447944 RepID=A0A6A4GPM3_9AGAR|nr:hypothetical protein BT96DRAFT_1005340 [Gymnopus androsaceus JB14]